MPAPDYQVLVALTRTGQVVDALDASAWSFADTLAWSSPGSMTVTVQLLGRDRLGKVTLDSLSAIAQGGSAYSLILVRDGRALWAGPVMTLGFDEASVQIGCSSLPKFFDGRMVIQDPYYGIPNDPKGNIHLELGLRDRAIELLTRGTTGLRRELPIDLPAQSGIKGPAIDYLSSDLGTVYERVKEAVEGDGGPDVFLSPYLSLDQSSVRWTVNVGNPRLGSTTSVATFDLDGTVASLAADLDFSAQVTTGYVPGDISAASGAGTRLIGVASVDPGDPYPMFERADRTSVSNKRQDELDALARSYVAAYGQAVRQWTVTVRPDARPWYGDDFTVGDVVTFSVVGHPFLADGDYPRRVTGVSSYSFDAVTIETSAVPS